MDDDTIKALVAMGCITALEVAALATGINGLMLVSAIGALATIAGYEIGTIRAKRKKE